MPLITGQDKGSSDSIGMQSGVAEEKEPGCQCSSPQVKDLIWPCRTPLPACPIALKSGKTASNRNPTYKNSGGGEGRFPLCGKQIKESQGQRARGPKGQRETTPFSPPSALCLNFGICSTSPSIIFLEKPCLPGHPDLRTRPSRGQRQLLCQTSPLASAGTSHPWNSGKSTGPGAS